MNRKGNIILWTVLAVLGAILAVGGGIGVKYALTPKPQLQEQVSTPTSTSPAPQVAEDEVVEINANTVPAAPVPTKKPSSLLTPTAQPEEELSSKKLFTIPSSQRMLCSISRVGMPYDAITTSTPTGQQYCRPQRVLYFTFSSNGEHYAYFIESELNKFDLILDGKKVPKNANDFDYLSNPEFGGQTSLEDNLAFSADGKRFAYVTKNGSHQPAEVVVDGKRINLGGSEFKPLPVIPGLEGKLIRSLVSNLIFSSDGRYFAFMSFEEPILYDRDKKIEIDYRPTSNEPYTVTDIRFTPDNRLLYYMWHGYRWFVIHDIYGKEKDITISDDQKNLGSMIVSPDGKKIAYEFSPEFLLPGEKGESFVVLNGVKQKDYQGNGIGNLAFSEDGAHLAYSVRDASIVQNSASVSFIVFDGKELDRRTGSFFRSNLKISPDGNHFLYRAGNKDGFFLVVDGKDGQLYDSNKQNLNVSNPVFLDNSHVMYFVLKGQDLWRIVELIP